MDRVFHGFRTLFCVCFVCAAAAVLGLDGYALALLAAIGVWLLVRRRPLPRFTLLLLLGGFVLRVFAALVLHPPIESDFRLMFEAAQGLNAGDLSFQNTVYFSLWAYQSVFVAWQALWLRLWNDPMCLELLNALLAAGTVCLLYRMARRWVDERAAQAAALLLTLFPFALTLHTVLSNQIPSAFFLALGLWVLVCEDCARLGFWRFPLAGLALQCGNLLRSEGVILLVAVLAWAVFEGLRHPQTVKRLLAGMLALLAVYFAGHAAADAAVRASGLNDYGVQNGDPGWKFVTGLNYDTCGGYSQQDWAQIYPTLDENHQVTAETDAVQRALIAERLQAGPVRLMRHAVNKVRFLWGTDALHWVFGHTQQYPGQPFGLLSMHAAYRLIREFDRGLFVLALGLAAFGLIGPKDAWKRRPAAAYLPFFVFFAAFCALLLIEVQPRYAYLPQLYVFTAAAFGLARLHSGKEEQHA